MPMWPAGKTTSARRRRAGLLTSAAVGARLLAAAVLAMPCMWVGAGLLNVWVAERAVRDTEASHLEQYETFRDLSKVPASEMRERARSERRWREIRRRRDVTSQDQSLRMYEFAGARWLVPTDWRLPVAAVPAMLAGPLFSWLGLRKLWPRAGAGRRGRLRREGAALLCLLPALLASWTAWSARRGDAAVDSVPLVTAQLGLLAVLAVVAAFRLREIARRARRSRNSRTSTAARDLPVVAVALGLSLVLLPAAGATHATRFTQGQWADLPSGATLAAVLLCVALGLGAWFVASLWRISRDLGRVRLTASAAAGGDRPRGQRA